MATGDLTDLATVKTWIGLASDAGASDTLLSALITAASDFVVQYLNRPVLTASYTEVREGNGHAFMLLRNGPITAVASVGFANGLSVTAQGDPIAGTQGYLFDGRKLSLVGYEFPRGRHVVIAYTAGYTTVPPAIQQAVNELVGEAFKRRDRIGQLSKTLGGQETVSFSTLDMNKTIASMLAGHRSVAPV